MAVRLVPGLTIGETRRAAAELLREGGMDSVSLDVRILIGHALGLDHAQLAAQQDRVLTDGESEAIAALITRRIAGEPVARILGEKEFWGLPFVLSADTLVPRPETETLVEAAIDVLARRAPPQPERAFCCSRCCPNIRRRGALAATSVPAQSQSRAPMQRALALPRARDSSSAISAPRSPAASIC
jgi:methylase of polypeptide subunit release factors